MKNFFKKILIILPIFAFFFMTIFSFLVSSENNDFKNENNNLTTELKTLNNNISKKSLRQDDNGQYYTLSASSAEIILVSDNIGGVITISYNFEIEYFIPKANKSTIYSNSAFITSVVKEYKNGGVILTHDASTIHETFDAGEILISAIKVNVVPYFTYVDLQAGLHTNLTCILYGQNEPSQTFKQNIIALATTGWSTYNDYSNNYWLECGELITAMSLFSYETGYFYGLEEGYTEGYYVGKDVGLEEGKEFQKDLYEQNDTALSKIWDILENGIETALNVLSIEILPGIPLTICIIVPLIFGIIFFIWKGGAQ